MAEENPEESLELYVQKNYKTINVLEKIFSRKAVEGLKEGYLSKQYWFKEVGEEPVIVNEKKVKTSSSQLNQFYKNKGYFNSTISDTVKYMVDKADVSYFIDLGNAYIIDTIEYDINSDLIRGLFEQEKNNSFIVKGKQYNQNDFFKEQKRLTYQFRNSGIFDFQNRYISFVADTNIAGPNVNIKMIISDKPKETKSGIIYVPYTKYFINKVNIHTDFTFDNKYEPIKDSVKFDDYYFLSKEKNRYTPNMLTDAILLKSGDLYKDDNKVITNRLLTGLGVFRIIDIKVRKDLKDENNNGIITDIFLTPQKRNTTKFEIEGTNSNMLGVGLASNFSFTNRNTFGGTEIFTISLNGMVGNQKEAVDVSNSVFNAYQYGLQANLTFPRFLLPFDTRKYAPKDMSPRTVISGSMNKQLNIGLSKNSSNASIIYSWNESETKQHNIQLYNLQYIKYLNSQFDYFNTNPTEKNNIIKAQEKFIELNPEYADEDNGYELYKIMLTDVEFSKEPEYIPFVNSIERFSRLTQDYLISSSSYTFIYNSQRKDKKKSFLYFRGKAEIAGTMFSILDKFNALPVNNSLDSSKTVLGLPFAQFAKFDLDFRKYWRLNSTDKIAFRLFTGFTLPFGNSSTIPFERSYFSGGVSDVRAWNPYDLGPADVRYYPFDYSYDKLKITTSLEYRIKVFKQFDIALFADAGNIWDINGEDETVNFRFSKFYKQMGVGVGYGLRYDFNFFIFRFDFAFKAYDPSKTPNLRWVLMKQSFFNPVVNFAVGYPF